MTPLPTEPDERKKYQLYTGLVKYFPRALCEVARCSYEGSVQHHPDMPVHWDRDKSPDDADAMLRHMVEGDWVKVAWRALAVCEKHLEQEAGQ